MTSSRRFKDSIYEQFGRIGKALGSPRRLELLDLLCQAPRTVEGLAREAGQSLANTSHHLQVLRRARLVDAEKRGVTVTYRLADRDVGEFFRTLTRLADARLAEIDRITGQFFEARDAMEPVDRDTLLRRVRLGEVTVLDVRPYHEYCAGHIAGAVSVPLGKLEGQLDALPRDREVVAYCRGPYCVLAVQAVELLRAEGFRAARLEDGVLEWRARGFDIVEGPEASLSTSGEEAATGHFA